MLDIAFSLFVHVIGLTSWRYYMAVLEPRMSLSYTLYAVVQTHLKDEASTDVVGPIPPLTV